MLEKDPGVSFEQVVVSTRQILCLDSDPITDLQRLFSPYSVSKGPPDVVQRSFRN